MPSTPSFSSVQYFCAIELAQTLNAASFEVVAKLVEFVQMVSAEAWLLMLDWINSAHFFSLTPCHSVSAAEGIRQDAEIMTTEAMEIEDRRLINSGLREIFL